ncbi:MAG: PLP-dependent aminotransferase family protein [Clostridiales bacterium]
MIFSKFTFNSKLPKYKQLEKFIINNINKENLIYGNKLPSTRELSKLLKVSRNLIVSVYENLESAGYLEIRNGSGTFVILNRVRKKNNISENILWESYINKSGKMARELDIVKTQYKWEKGMIAFKSIAPDENLFDLKGFKRAFLDMFSIEGNKILNYGYAKGYQKLIDWLKEYMKCKGVNTDGKDILITNGFTEGFNLVTDTIINKKDGVLVEEPTHNTALKILKLNEVELISITMDKDGINYDILKKKILEKKPKFIYITPSYHNPTGIVMSAERRSMVYKILRDNNIIIIEDGFNEELLYLNSHLLPLSSYSNRNDFIYIGSFSKILYPGLRIGWILADNKLIDTLESVKRTKTIHCSTLDQAILYYYLNGGDFEKYIKKVRKYYADKYRLIVEFINKYINYEEISGEGGLHVFIKLKKNYSVKKIIDECYKKGVIFMPGSVFYKKGDDDSTIRLGFSKLTDKEIEKGIKVIGEVIYLQNIDNNK